MFHSSYLKMFQSCYWKIFFNQGTLINSETSHKRFETTTNELYLWNLPIASGVSLYMYNTPKMGNWIKLLPWKFWMIFTQNLNG